MELLRHISGKPTRSDRYLAESQFSLTLWVYVYSTQPRTTITIIPEIADFLINTFGCVMR